MKVFHLFMITSLFCSSLFIHASQPKHTQDPRYRTIFIQTANNKKIPCNADQNIEVFFQQCRLQGDCKGPQLTLLFDRWEIKEGTPAANKRFNQYNTTVKEAFIQESLDNKALHNSTTTQTNNSTATNNDTRVQDFFAGVAATVAAAILYLIH